MIFPSSFSETDYYGKKWSNNTVDDEFHQSMIADLEKKLGDSLGTSAVISDRRKQSSMPLASLS